jgi:DNA end-binding protein Ku
MASRPIGKATVSFGMISVPITVHNAASSKDVTFHSLHVACKTRLKQQYICPTCGGIEVPTTDRIKGYEYDKSTLVPISNESLELLPLPTKNVIALDAFVRVSEVGREYLEKTYYIRPDKDAALKPYVMLLRALRTLDVGAVAKYALRNKESLVLIRPATNTLILEQLFWPDELKLAEATPLPDVVLSPKEEQLTTAYVEAILDAFDPSGYRDLYREAVLALIEREMKGLPAPAAPELPAPPPESDTLQSQLEAMIAAAEAMKAKKAA